MSDTKKILIAAISVVLVVAIVAGVSIGVLAGKVNNMEDQVAELAGLKQTVEALQSENDAMKAEIAEATANNEKLVTAEDFEAKLAAAIGEQNQTMQALVSTAVKNQIEELGVEGLTEAQVKEIINAAVANCITEDEVNELIANSDTGLTEAEVKKLIINANAGFLTYAQIVNLIDDNIYDLRNYLESVIAGVQDGLTTMLVLSAEDAVGGVYTIDNEAVSNLASGINSIVTLSDDDWSEISIVIDEDLSKRFEFYLYADIDELVVNTYYASIRISANVNTLIVKTTDAFIGVNSAGSVGTLIAEDCGNEDADRNASVSNSGEIGEFVDNADGYTVTIVGNNPNNWMIVDGDVEYAMSEQGAVVTISGEGAVATSAFESDTMVKTVIIEEGITSIGAAAFKRCSNLTSVTLPEGLKSIDAEAFCYTNALTTINFPSTLETIGEKAFRGVGLTSLTLPATVKTLEAGAFRDMANVETITIEGTTSLAPYAFRSCANLKTVILNGEPTFNGKGQYFCNLDTGDASKITIYVTTDAVETAVKENNNCQNYKVSKIATSDNADEVFANAEDGGVVVLGEDMTIVADNLKNASDLTVVLGADTTVTVASGAAGSKNLTFTGDKSSTVVLVNTNPGYEGTLSYQDNANLTFKGITFDASQISGICARGGVVIFEDCIIKGELEKTIASKFVFSGCTFDVGVTQVGYGCSDVVFEDCDFESDGYGIKIYSEGQTPINLTVKDCSFKNTGSAAESAILLDHIIAGITYNITVEDCTFEGYTEAPVSRYNKWEARAIVAGSAVKTSDGQYIFAYQTAENTASGFYKTLTMGEDLVVTVK